MIPNFNRPILSICLTCRDNRESENNDIRGGSRLAQALFDRLESHEDLPFDLRGVSCMSQCKRPCAAAICSRDRFSYMFGDLDPEKTDNIDALLELPALYIAASEGFLRRRERPLPLQSRIVARIPPSISSSTLVTPLRVETVK